jgi:hypothetical protein
MGCGASSQIETPPPAKQKVMRSVSKVEGGLSTANQAVNAVGAVAEELPAAAVAEKGIESLLAIFGAVPLVGDVARLLEKCWEAAKVIKKSSAPWKSLCAPSRDWSTISSRRRARCQEMTSSP